MALQPETAVDDHHSDIPILLVGTARPVPGRTVEEGVAVILDALLRAATGEQVLDPEGQCGVWLHRRFIASRLNVGKKTWKHLRRVHAEEIAFDDTQQWVRAQSAVPR